MIAQRAGSIKVLALCVLLGTTGCVLRNSDDLNAYYRYNECRERSCFETLSASEKTATFFGAMEIHPPDLSVEQEISRQDIAYLKSLKREIERRGGSYEAYSFVGAMNKKRQRGEISDKQLEQLNLAEFCRSRGDMYNMCNTIVPTPSP